MDFHKAFGLLMGHEGGFVDDPNDPGGRTKYGISQRSYPDLDIKNLTLREARRIYYEDYWQAVRADNLPGWLRFDVFDGAVNSGPKQSIKWLQFAVGAAQDGIIGNETLSKARDAKKPRAVLMRMAAARLMFMSKTKNVKHHGAGWMVRMAKNIFRGSNGSS